MEMKNKTQIIDEYYKEEVDFLKNIAERHAIKEEELFPHPLEQIDMFDHDLSICLIEGIRLKGKRWIKKYKTTNDINIIREELWKYRTKLPELYGDIDEEWYNILNAMLSDTYGVWFIDSQALKQCADYAHMKTVKVKDIVIEMARDIHRKIKNGDINTLEVIDKTPESFIGQNNY